MASLVHGYSSDEDATIATVEHDTFNLAAVESSKRQRFQDTALNTTPQAAPDVLAQVGLSHFTTPSLLMQNKDPLNQTSLITRPTDTQMNVNIPYDDMTLPVQGPENPFGDRNRFANQNALAGHVEEQAMSEHAFRTQHLTHFILGYSQNPSVDPKAPAILGSLETAEANNYAMLDSVRITHEKRKELKRKRKPKGDLEVVDGDNAYAGPWASWAGEEPVGVIPDGEGPPAEEASSESEAEDPIVKKAKPKRGAPGQESSVFHGQSTTDYQGRTYISPPLSEAPHLQSEPGSKESFIPKVCIHTWTGHTNGVSVIRLFPETGHLLLSGSMDTKMKVFFGLFLVDDML